MTVFQDIFSSNTGESSADDVRQLLQQVHPSALGDPLDDAEVSGAHELQQDDVCLKFAGDEGLEKDYQQANPLASGTNSGLNDFSSQSDNNIPLPPTKIKKIRTAAAAVKAATQTWLKIDRLGCTTLVTTDKYRVAIKLGVQPRDLRLLDPQMSSVSPPAILDRERAIVVNIGSIKCIITLEYVLVVNPDDETGSQLAAVLKEKLSNPMHVGKMMSYPGLSRISMIPKRSMIPNAAQPVVYGLSFELKVLEICLDMVVDSLEVEAKQLEQLILPTLDELTRKVKPQGLEVMRRGKNRLTRLVKRIETIKEVLEKFLEDDEDMHKLNLTAQEATRQASLLGAGAIPEFHGPSHTPRSLSRASRRSNRSSKSSSSSSSSSSGSRSTIDFEDEAEIAEVEMLLEAYQMHLDNLFNKMQTLEQFVQDTEDLVNTSLDTHRNRIISVDIVLTAFYTALGISTAVTGIFSMNVNFHGYIASTKTNFILVGALGAIIIPMVLLVLFLIHAFRQRLVRLT